MLKSMSALVVWGLLTLPISYADSVIKEENDSSDTSSTAHYIQQLEEINENISFIEAELMTQQTPALMPLTVEGRLRYIQQQVPLDYNEQVQSFIATYTSQRYKNHIGRMLGLSAYYFPIFERIFTETGLPEEIKYLAIVESALNPQAVSHMGATGPWQFMYATAKMYDLTIDKYIDERKDPIAASYAASTYLLDAYQQFGDWLLAIASYNCGPGNVTRAIQRSGLENPDYWAISPYLPQETRNYVPAFIAMTYMFSFHKEHGIETIPAIMLKETEEIAVNKPVSLQGIAKALDVDIDQLRTLNPAYSRDVVNGAADAPKRVILPAVDARYYPSLYAALNHGTGTAVLMNAANTSPDRTSIVKHKVRKGESLGKIAAKYKVTVQDLRAWNNIKKNTIVPGQQLQIKQSENGDKTAPARKNNASYITYKVKKGDTLSTIAQRHRGVTVSKIKADNGLKSNNIKPGMTLKLNKG